MSTPDPRTRKRGPRHGRGELIAHQPRGGGSRGIRHELRRTAGIEAQQALVDPERRAEVLSATTTTFGAGGYLGTDSLGSVRAGGLRRRLTDHGPPVDPLEHFPEGGTVDIVASDGSSRPVPSDEARPADGGHTVIRLPNGMLHFVKRSGRSWIRATWEEHEVTKAELRSRFPSASATFIAAMRETNRDYNAYLLGAALDGVDPRTASARFAERAQYELVNMLAVTILGGAGMVGGDSSGLGNLVSAVRDGVARCEEGAKIHE